MSNAPACDCIECRVRKACRFEDGVPADIREPLIALGNVMSELLAFLPARNAKLAVADLLEARKKWLKHPRVAAQQTPAGNA